MKKEEMIEIIKETVKKLKDIHQITVKERQMLSCEHFEVKYKRSLSQKQYEYLINISSDELSTYFQNDGPIACASFYKNYVQFNIPKLLNTILFGKVGYKKEQKYIQKNCCNPKQILIWAVCHEYCHTVRIDIVNHTNDFYNGVEKLYQLVK